MDYLYPMKLNKIQNFVAFGTPDYPNEDLPYSVIVFKEGLPIYSKNFYSYADAEFAATKAMRRFF